VLNQVWATFADGSSALVMDRWPIPTRLVDLTSPFRQVD
jgi:hypothetical protein